MSKRILIVFLAGLCFNFLDAQEKGLRSHKELLLLMGTRFEITAVSTHTSLAEEAVMKAIQEIERIEALISSWKKTSQTSEINTKAGVSPVKVDMELFNLIERSMKISALTEGAFDISFASIASLYSFDGMEHLLPSKNERERSIQKINWHKIKLDRGRSTVFLTEKGMKIGFGGIGKGYAANQAIKIMKNIPGIEGAVVNAAGDLMTWGDNGKDEEWSIQISDPENPEFSIGQLKINNASVVTSGDYEKYFINEGTRYAHIINPKTGLPTTGIKSATVVCPDAELGDALATSLFVLGIEKGLNLINKLKNVEALIISDQNQVFTSKNLHLNDSNEKKL